MQTIDLYTHNTVSRHRYMHVLRENIEKLKADLEVLGKINYVRETFDPLAAAIAKKIKAKSWKVEGPFGLGCHIVMSFAFKGIVREKSVTIAVGKLLDTGQFDVVDFSKTLPDYPAGSIGAINGLNHPRVTVNRRLSLGKFISRYIK